MIKAIETVYKGYKFRSRLEARWAVFFDAMGEKWEYEKEGFDLDGEYYLPDFYLPRFNLYLEIKGEHPKFAEIAKCDKLCEAGQGIILAYGLPLQHIGKLFCYDIKESGSGGSSHWDMQFRNDEDDYLLIEILDDDGREYYSDSSFLKPIHKAFPFTDAVELALAQAKQARFEHGESGYSEAPKRFIYGKENTKKKKRFIYGRDED